MADYEMDSWDEEEEKEWQKQRARGYNEMSYQKEQQRRAASDLRKYRNNYPDRPKVYLCQSGTIPEMQNLDFYLNKKSFKPNGEFIKVILDQWKNDYELLERNSSYIDWLFPLQEQGMNYRARMLTKMEIELMKKDKEVQRRFLEAYKLMLGFYGIKLVNEATGEVKRAEKFEERFDNLDFHSHNNLRITRILKCLGELGFEHYQAPLVKFFLVETLVEKQLPGVKKSVLGYFMFTVKDKQQRRDLVHFAWENYEPRQKFIWGPIEKLKKYKKPSECDSDVGREKGGKENMAETQEAEKSPGRLEEDNVTEVTQLKAETECELTSSAECQNQENESDEEETNLSNEEKTENDGGLDNDDKKPGPKMDGRKRKLKGGRTDDLTQTASTSDEELSNKMTENCTIIQMHPVKTGKTDDKDEAKKVTLERNSNGDSGNGERFLGSDPKESEVLLGAKEPPHQMNVKQDPLQDKAEGNQTNSYL